MLEVMLLTPDPAMWASLLGALLEDIPTLLKDPAGLPIIARTIRLLDEAGTQDELKVIAGRVQQRLASVDVREAVMRAMHTGSLPSDDADLLMRCGGADALSGLILELPTCPSLGDRAIELLTQAPGLLDDVSRQLAKKPDAAAAGLALIAEALPLGLLMRLWSPLIGSTSAEAVHILTSALARRCGHWSIELLQAALAQPGTELNELALVQSRGRTEPEVADVLARFFSGQIGGAMDRRAFQAAADTWAGTGPDRKRRLLSLSWFLVRGCRSGMRRRAWWSFSLAIRRRSGGEKRLEHA
jgi:hypothetical protein